MSTTTTTFIARHTDGTVMSTRSSATMAYTHAVLVTPADADKTPGTYSWHTTQENARKAKDSLAGNANVGTAKTGDVYTVIPVEAHAGGKAKVLKALAAQATQDDPKPSKATRVQAIKDNAAAANAAPVEPKTVAAAEGKPTKKVTAKATDKPKTTGKATKATATKATAPKADPKPATSSAPEGHPGHTWLKLLVESGLSQTQAATAMEVAPMTLNRLINGKGIPTANVTIRFAGAVNKPVKPLWDEVAAYELTVALAASKSA